MLTTMKTHMTVRCRSKLILTSESAMLSRLDSQSMMSLSTRLKCPSVASWPVTAATSRGSA